MVLAEMGRIREHCSVHLRTFDATVSPHNCIILGCSSTGDADSTIMQAAEERMRRAYDRAHRRPQKELGKVSDDVVPKGMSKSSIVETSGGCSAWATTSADYE